MADPVSGGSWLRDPGDGSLELLEGPIPPGPPSPWYSYWYEAMVDSMARLVEAYGAVPGGTSEANGDALALAMALGGNITLGEANPGVYTIDAWPSGVDVDTTLRVAAGTTLTDGASSIVGPVELQGGLWPNGRVAVDGACASGVAAVTSAAIEFVQADVGKRILITDPETAASFGSSIASVAGTTATLASAPGITVSGGTVVVGTDNSAALQGLAAALDGKGGTLALPVGIFVVGAMVEIPGGTTLQGAGHDYGVVEAPAQRGTVVIGTLPGQSAVIRLGTDSAEFTSGYTAPRMQDISVDGGNVATNAVIATARRTRITRSQIWRGSGNALSIVGQNTNVTESIVGQTNAGDVIDASNASDLKILNNEIRQGGSGHQIRISDCGNVLISGNHMYKGFNGLISASHAGSNIYATCTATRDGLIIIGNQFDGTYGHHVEVVTTAASTRYGDVVINGNYFLQIADFPNDTFSVAKFTAAASSSIRAVAMIGNVGKAVGANSYKAIAELSGAGALTHCTVQENNILNCNAVFSGFTPDSGSRNNAIAVGAGTAVVRSSNQGAAASIADGGTITHGMATTPVWVRCTPSVAGEMVSVTALGSTTFTVAIKKHDNSAGTTQTIYWDAGL